MSVKKKVNLLDNFSHSVGCFLKKGALVPGYAITSEHRMLLNKSTFNIMYSEAAGKYFYSTDERVYVTSDLVNIVTFVIHNGVMPFFVEDYIDGVKRFVAVYGKTATVFYYYEESMDITMKAEMKCGVMHCGRLFGASGFDVWWSGPGGVADWEEGIGGCGRLSLEPGYGAVLNMAVFGGKIIVVREHGLTVLSAYGSPENFSVDFTDTDCDRIYKDTSQVIGDKFYFFSASGLKCFDGSKISFLKIRHKVKEPWSSTKYDGVYFLACKSETLDRDVILCVDSEDGESCILDEQAELVYSLPDSVRFSYGKYHYTLERCASFRFESEVDFGTGRDKTITKIECEGSPKISVNNGKFTRSIKTVNGITRPRMRGKRFKVTIEHDKPVKWATAYAEVTDAV